jgi:hypothetical protein
MGSHGVRLLCQLRAGNLLAQHSWIRGPERETAVLLIVVAQISDRAAIRLGKKLWAGIKLPLPSARARLGRFYWRHFDGNTHRSGSLVGDTIYSH